MSSGTAGTFSLQPRKSLEEVIVEELKEASNNSLESSNSDASDALKKDQFKFRRPLLGANHKAAQDSGTSEDSNEGPLGPQSRRRRWFALPQKHTQGNSDDDALSRISEGTAASTHGRQTITGSEGPTPRAHASQPPSPGDHTPVADGTPDSPLTEAQRAKAQRVINLFKTPAKPVPGSKAAEWPPTKSDHTAPLPRPPGIQDGARISAHSHPAGDLHTAPNTPRSPRGQSPGDPPLSKRLLRPAASKRRSSFHLFRHSPKAPSDSSGSHPSDNEEDFNFEDLDENLAQADKPLWKTAIFWKIAIPWIIAIILIVLGGAFLASTSGGLRYKDFSFPRWLIFVGMFVPVWWLGRGIVKFLVFIIEGAFFTQKRALYYIMGTKKPLKWMLRAVFLIPLWAGIFGSQPNKSKSFTEGYGYAIKALVCLFLFTLANVIKAFIAKLIATHFHKEQYFERMQAALRKEYFIMALSIPRSQAGVAEEEAIAKQEAIEDGKLAEYELGGSAGRRQRSAIMSALPKMVRFRATMQTIGDKTLGNATALTDKLKTKGPFNVKRAHDAEGALEAARKADYQDAPPAQPQAARDAVLNPPMPTSFRRRSSHRSAQSGRASSERLSPGLAAPGGIPVATQGPTKSVPGLDKRHSGMDQRSDRDSPLGYTAAGSTSKRRPPQSRYSRSMTGQDRLVARSEAEHASQQTGSQGGWGKLRGKLQHSKSILDPTRDRKAERKEKQEKDLRKLPGCTAEQSPEELLDKIHKVEKHIRKNNLTITFTGALGQATREERVTSDKEAKKLAFYLFWNIKPSFTRTYILPSDLEEFLAPQEVEEAFHMLDENGNGKVSLHEIRDAVINIFNERRNLATSLKDTKNVMAALERVIGVIVHVVFIVFYLLIFNVNVSKVWLTLSSVIVAFSFIFGNSIQNMFNAVVLLFGVHPFDVGDALYLLTSASATKPDYVVVEEISLNTTIVVRWDGARIWFPNANLIKIPLLNLTRSDNLAETLTVLVDIGTPGNVVETLAAALKEFVEARPMDYSAHDVMFTTGADPLKLGLLVFYQFAHTGTDLGRTGHARSALYTIVSATLTRLGVGYSMPSVKRTRPGEAFNSQARTFARGAPATLLTGFGSMAGLS